MKQAAFIVFVALVVAGCSRDSVLDVSYQDFDQTPRSGWRVPAGEKKYQEAAKLIDQYLERNSTVLDTHQRSSLAFHAGQLYAFCGDYEHALDRLKQAPIPDEPLDSPIKWNAYVEATIAFISGDRAKLVLARDEVAKGVSVNGEVPNLKIVDALIENLGRPYSEVYGKSH